MWDTSLKLLKKAKKEQKETALKDLQEHFDFNYTSDELVGVWKSLRACMLREVKRIGKDTASSQWKYFNQMQFLRPSIERSKPEWSDNEKHSLINFYNTNPSLWNHHLKDYHDRARRQVLLQQLAEQLAGKYTKKEIVTTWNNIKTYFDRE